MRNFGAVQRDDLTIGKRDLNSVGVTRSSSGTEVPKMNCNTVEANVVYALKSCFNVAEVSQENFNAVGIKVLCASKWFFNVGGVYGIYYIFVCIWYIFGMVCLWYV